MAFRRTLKVEHSSGVVLAMDDGQGDGSTSLDCTFLCKQATVQSSPQGEARIYNVATKTAKAIPATGGLVTISAGYADEGTSIIYKGELRQRRIGREDQVRTFVDLFCAGGDNAYNFATVSKTLAKGSKPQDHLDLAKSAMEAMGVTEGYIDRSLLSSPRFPRAAVFHSMARDVLRTLAHTVGAEWWVADQKLFFVKKDESVPGAGTQLNSQTGMVGTPTETPSGIEVVSLLTGKIGVGSVLMIDEASIQRTQLDQSYSGPSSQGTNALANLGTADGSYVVKYLERVGHLRGQEWYNRMTCIGAKTGVTPQGLTSVIGGDSTSPNFSGAST